MKRIISAILCITMFLSLAYAVHADERKFTDVAPDAWYYNDVMNAVALGLVNGKSETTFAPDDNLTYAEAFKLAACMNQLATAGTVTLKNGEEFWYSTYAEYCMTHGIIDEFDFMLLGEDFDPNVKITRSGYMNIFANALPSDMLPAINYIPAETIPDVSMSANFADGIYKLYRAGIVQGSDKLHNCKPFDNIKRSEVAAILTRMMDKTKRVRFDMGTPVAYDPLALSEAPKATVPDSGDRIDFTVKVTGGVQPYRYAWHCRDEDEDMYMWMDIGKFISIEGDEISNIFSGYNADMLSLLMPPEALGGTINVKCVVTDAIGNTLTTDAITFTSDAKKDEEENKEDKGAKYYLDNKDESRGENPTSPIKVTVSGTQFKFKAGERLSITVEATGGTPPYYTYRWYRYSDTAANWVFYTDGQINPTTGYDPTLYLYDSLIKTPGETFLFKCVVKDSEGYTGESAAVTVTTSGFVLEQGLSEKTEVVVGEDVELAVKVKGGVEPYKYEWYLGTFVIPTKDYTMTPMRSLSGDTVKFTMIPGYLPASDNVVTSFRCIVTDAEGSKVDTYTEIVDKTAKNMPLTIVKQPERVNTPKYGAELNFDVAVYGGKQPYSYEWFYDSRYRNEVTPISLNTLSQTVVRRSNSNFTSNIYIVLREDTPILDKEIYCVVTDAAGNTVKSEKIAVCPDYLMIALEQKTGENVYVGTVKSGELASGDRIGFQTIFDGEHAYVSGTVEKIEMFGKSLDKATVGDRAVIYLTNVTVYEKEDDLKEILGDPAYRHQNIAFEMLPSVLSITHYKTSYGTTPGEDVNLSVYINGGSGTYKEIEWFKEVGGEWISFDKTFRGSQTSKGFLMSYLYRGEKEPTTVKAKCIVTDSDGNKAQSTVINITTSGIAFANELPESQSVKLGEQVSFSVKVEGGTEPYTYNWFITGKRYDGAYEKYDLKNDGTCTGYDADTVTFTVNVNHYSIPRTIEKWVERSIRCEVTDATGAKITTAGTILSQGY